MKAKREPKKLKWWGWLILAALATAVVSTIIFRWETYEEIFGDSIAQVLLIQVAIFFILLYSFPKFRKWIRDTIGEKPPIQKQRRWYQFIFPALFAMPFVFYVLLAGINESLPPVSPAIKFSLLAVTPTLGGLVLAAAGNSRLPRKAYIELISVAQKLILATVLLIVFASLFFTANLLESADIEFLYWCSFWGSMWAFYPGVFLFLLGISDLVFALRHLRR